MVYTYVKFYVFFIGTLLYIYQNKNKSNNKKERLGCDLEDCLGRQSCLFASIPRVISVKIGLPVLRVLSVHDLSDGY